jgi:hypothetical protein
MQTVLGTALVGGHNIKSWIDCRVSPLSCTARGDDFASFSTVG